MPDLDSLWGDEFSIMGEQKTLQILKKIKEPKKVKEVKPKTISSKKLSLDEKLSLIKENVYKILGQHKEDTLVIKTKEELVNYFNKAIQNKLIVIDTETNNSLDPITCKLMGPCLYTQGMKQAYVPINHVDLNTRERLSWQLNEEDCKEQFQRLVDNDVKIVFHNGKFDYQVIKETCGIELPIYWDTLIGARLLNENEKANLKDQYIIHIDQEHEKYSIEKLFEKEEYAIFDPNTFSLYAATDAYMTYKLYEYQVEQFKREENSKVYRLFRDVEIPLVIVTANMELNGIEIDIEYAKRLNDKYDKQLNNIDSKINEELIKYKNKINTWRLTPEANIKSKKSNGDGGGKSKNEQLDEFINLDSPIQLAIFIYDVLGLETVDKEHPRGTGEEILKELYGKYKIELLNMILERRGLVKLINTYIKSIPELANNWEDHRVRTHFNQCGTDTGRYSSSQPINLQNIPSHNKEIRMLFRAKPGCVLVGSDYSAQEPRLTAHYSQDENMINAYKEGKDLYAVIAQKMFNNRYEDNLEFYPEGTKIIIDGKEIICGNKTHLNKKGKERRSNAKTMLLGILYGMSAKTTGEGMGKSYEEGKALIDNFYRGFPKVKKWIDETKKNAYKNGYVEDWYGRRRRLPDIQLPPYEIRYKDNKNELTDFNPFLHCTNRLKDDKLIKTYKDRCNNIKSYKEFDSIKNDASKDGIIIKSNTTKIALAERQCVNARVQGGAATLTKMAMINIFNDKELNDLGFKLLITVHDEVLGECPKENANKVANRLVQVMIDTAKPYIDTPMKCDPYIVSSWYEDEWQVTVINDYDKLLEKMPKDVAFDKLCEIHNEATKEILDKILK